MCSQQARDRVSINEELPLPDILSCSNSNALRQRTDVSAQLLHWSPSVNAGQVASLTEQGLRLFDVIIASDCLFFKDFHADLLQTLDQLLVPGGVGIFLQPSRDRTLQKFADLCTGTGAFQVEMIEDYSPEVTILIKHWCEVGRCW